MVLSGIAHLTAQAAVAEPEWMTLARREARGSCHESQAAIDKIVGYYWNPTGAPGRDSLAVYLQLRLYCNEASGDSSRIAATWVQLGDVYADAERVAEAERYLYSALAYYERTGDPEGAARAAAALCYLLVSGDVGSDAVYMCERAAAAGERQDDPFVRYRSLENLPEAYQDAGDSEAALRASDRLFAVIRDASYPWKNEVWYILSRGRADILLALDRPAEAIQVIEEGLRREPVPDDERYFRLELRSLRGTIYYGMGEYRAAKRDLLPLVNYALAEGDTTTLVGVLADLGDTYQALGRPDSALYYLQLYYEKEIDEHQVSLSQLRSELATRYRNEAQRKTIETSQLEINRQRQIQRLLIGGGGLLLLALTGILFVLRQNRRKNAQLAVQNDRNELLLKEIHHRVKNNLETVSSLLELQSATLTDDRALAAMQAGQSRVQSMGLLHQKLYQGKNLAAIEMKDYFTHLATGLLETYQEEDRIAVTVDMPPLDLDVDTAIPLGLIVNELLTNAIKYAFPGADAGAVVVQMSRAAGNRYHLVVADNGVGKDVTAGPRGTGFGTRLVELLTRQLGGELTERGDEGVRTELIFSA